MKNVIRWVLLVPAAVAAYLLGYWFQRLILGYVIGHIFTSIEWLKWIDYLYTLFYEVVANISGVQGAMMVSFFVAPSYKVNAVKIMAVLFAVFGGVCLFASVFLNRGIDENPSIAIISSIAVIITAIYNIINAESYEERK